MFCKVLFVRDPFIFQWFFWPWCIVEVVREHGALLAAQNDAVRDNLLNIVVLNRMFFHFSLVANVAHHQSAHMDDQSGEN